MKKVIAGLMMSATVLGLAITAASVNVHADTTSVAAGTDASTNANLTVGAGSLSFTKPGDVNFKDATVENIYNGTYTDDTQANSTTVTDFSGNQKTWSLTARASGFNFANLNSDNASVLTVNGKTLSAGTAVSVADGATAANATNPTTTTGLKYALSFTKGTLVNQGSYQNTITWNLSNTPDANADSTND